jgi:hypothetical protein
MEKVGDECLFDIRMGSLAKIWEGVVVEFQIEHPKCLQAILHFGVSLDLLVDWLHNINMQCPSWLFLVLGYDTAAVAHPI